MNGTQINNICALSAHPETGSLKIIGEITESLDHKRLLEIASSRATQSEVIHFDLSEVIRVNSLGLSMLAKVFTELPAKVVVSRIPPMIVALLNASEDIIPDSIEIESFYARLYNLQTDAMELRCLTVGADIPILANYQDFDIEAILRLPSHLEADFDVESYFYFLTRRALRP